MRKDAKKVIASDIARVDRYHGGCWDEDYAFQGFKSNKYFTSDRYIPIDENFNRPDGKPLKGFGLEIETECRGVSNQTVLAEVFDKIIFPNFPADLFKMQNDSSLGGDTSAECITQVMTKEFIRNHYAAFKSMYDTYFPAFRITCGASCGMHTNISNAVFGRSKEAQELAIRKLFYIVNHHFSFCCALFNRDRRHTDYCSQMNGSKEYAKTVDLGHFSSNHGVCFNLGHYNTGRIELRIVGGQKNYPCFRNTRESVFFLCDRVKNISWEDCDDLAKIFRGCNQYVFDRIKSFCYEAGAISQAQIEEIRASVIREEFI